MVRILRSFDLLEAHIIVALLRYAGIDAQVFDADFVRQDWWKMLAYGGYRIVVPGTAVEAAREILYKYENGYFALDVEDRPACPVCAATAGVEDPWPRRNVFLLMFILPAVAGLAFAGSANSPANVEALLAATFVSDFVLPLVAVRYFKWRLRCQSCGQRWRAPPQRSRFAELSAMVDNQV
ncbi:MAG TPA: DUF2007 domain-containing protein [Rudaea sp.]|jgi:hypothetical protein